MKSIKTKRNTNSSFMSNHDLLENFRNKSFKLVTRQSSNTSIKHQVSLLKKKNFQKSQEENNKENNQLLANNSVIQVNKSKVLLQNITKKVNKCDYSVNLYEQNIETILSKIIKQLTFVHDELTSSEFIQLQMILSKNINKLSLLIPKMNQPKKQPKIDQNSYTDKNQALSKKIQDLKAQIIKLKKDKSNMKQKIEYLQMKIQKNQIQISQNISTRDPNNQKLEKKLNYKYAMQKLLKGNKLNENYFKNSGPEIRINFVNQKREQTFQKFLFLRYMNDIISWFMNKKLQSLMKDSEYYQSLKHYSPIFYSGSGIPLFLINKNFQKSSLCVSLSLILYGFIIYFFSRSYKRQKTDDNPGVQVVIFINWILLGIIFISFMLTQFLNPGVRNPQTISQQQFKQKNVRYCGACDSKVLQTMKHCKYCLVCVEDQNHHCGFFQKCMGNYFQTLMFRIFLLSVFTAFVAIFVMIIVYFI